jgi:hypothetical protein
MDDAEPGAHTDGVVHAAAGIVALVHTLDEWLAAACAERTRDALAQDDPALLAALGLVSLRKTVLRWLVHAAETQPVVKAKPGAALRGLLR